MEAFMHSEFDLYYLCALQFNVTWSVQKLRTSVTRHLF